MNTCRDNVHCALQRVVQDRRAKGEELGEQEILVWLLQVCNAIECGVLGGGEVLFRIHFFSCEMSCSERRVDVCNKHL